MDGDHDDGGRRRTGLVVGAVVAIAALLLALTVGAAVNRRDDSLVADPGTPAVPSVPGAPGPGTTVPPGTGGGQGSDPLAVDPSVPNPLPSPSAEELADLAEVFELVDDAELVMLEFLFESPASDDGSFTESELARASDVAATAVADLEALRAALEAAGSASGPDTPIRVAYLAHLQDWIDYTGAVARDPSLLLAGAGSYDQAINESAAGFTASIRAHLGDLSTLPTELADLVTEIVVRGFAGGGDDTQADI
jgi:hypothetical protein